MMSLAPFVYTLCLLASAACSVLLIRRYIQLRTPLLLWSAACFVFLALNNLLVVLDLVLLPSVDLTMYRTASSLGAVLTLLYGFIWELD
jgi:hypothetical protein